MAEDQIELELESNEETEVEVDSPEEAVEASTILKKRTMRHRSVLIV